MKKVILAAIVSSFLTATLAAVIVSPVTRIKISHAPRAYSVSISPIVNAVYKVPANKHRKMLLVQDALDPNDCSRGIDEANQENCE